MHAAGHDALPDGRSPRRLMTLPEPAQDQSSGRSAADVDVLIVGAGITGIYQLYRALEAGFSAVLLEAGDGVGGHVVLEPLSRSPVRLGELHLRLPVLEGALRGVGVAGALRPATGDRALPQPCGGPLRSSPPHAIRRPGHLGRLRRVGRGTWTVTTGDGTEYRARFLVAATGILSVPYFPDVPGRDDFRGESHHTGRWPTTPVDFAGKRVAVIGTGSSGVQVIPAIADEVASLTVYQRSANWCTPLNNRPITDRGAGCNSGPASRRCARRSTPRRPGSSIPYTIARPSTTPSTSAWPSSRRCGTARASRS